MCVRVRVRVRVRERERVRVCVSACLRACMYLFMYVCVRTYMCMHLYTDVLRSLVYSVDKNFKEA